MRNYRQLLLASLLLVLPATFIGCGGGGSGSNNGGGTPVPTRYSVSTDPDAGATVSPASAQVEEGKTAAFVITLRAGYVMDTVYCEAGGALVKNADATYTFTTSSINKADVVRVRTKQSVTLHRVTTVPSAGGTITPSELQVEDGKTATFTITPDSGGFIDTVGGFDGTLSGTQYTTGPVHEDGSVYATFFKPTSAYMLRQIRVSPTVLTYDEFMTTPVTLKVKAYGEGFTLFVEYNSKAFSELSATNDVQVQLYDDGTHGDAVAADHEYTATFNITANPALHYYQQTIDALRIYIVARNGSGQEVTDAQGPASRVSIGVASNTLSTAVTTLPKNLYATTHVVNVVYPNFRSYQATDQTVLWRLYNQYPDVFDAVCVAYVGATDVMNWPHSNTIKTPAAGLNMTYPFDASFAYGSNGKLSNLIVLGPNDITHGTFSHEFTHGFGMYYNKQALDLSNIVNDVNQGWAHPGKIGTHAGVLGGSAILEPVAGGDFRVAAKPVPPQVGNNSDLELYMMGLLSGDALGSQYFIPEPLNLIEYLEGTIVPRAKVTTYTVSDLERVYGARMPSAATAQKSFRVAFVIVSEQPLSATAMAYFTHIAKHYEAEHDVEVVVGGQVGLNYYTSPSFSKATRGLGTMITILPARK